MTAADAQFYWMSATIPNDQFLLYAFAGEGTAEGEAVAEILARARRCPDLGVRVRDGCGLTYPRWVRRDVGADQVVRHGPVPSWRACLDAVSALADGQLDLRCAAWRLHVFSPVPGVPGTAGTSTLAVLQLGHALADGARSAALAARLFGREDAVVPAVAVARPGCLLVRGAEAARAHRQLERDTAAGVVPAPAAPCPVLSVNTKPGAERTIRTVVRHRAQLARPTVTTSALAAISAALSGYVRDRGEDASRLGAEVPMTKHSVRQTNNHFGNVGVGLYPELRDGERGHHIADELQARHRRGRHPAFAAGDRAFAAIPAPLLRWGIRQFDADARPTLVTGNTVVSSVNRGAADLTFGGRPVVFTAGYPGLSPMMGLTHGVHGIGDTIAVSVHAAASAVDDLDEYVDRLESALGG